MDKKLIEAVMFEFMCSRSIAKIKIRKMSDKTKERIMFIYETHHKGGK